MASYKIGNKNVEDCTREELLEAVVATHQSRLRAEAEKEAYESLFKTNFPIHKLWTDFLCQFWGVASLILLIWIVVRGIIEAVE